ncbi:hypothetical protein ABW20_dc0102852 [Dactylellina cionopaga]|nr:hypothetical protein ABW20_dc0102852 [Dactylellina cionopaga]
MTSKRDDIEIGIICALPLEARAVRTLLEHTNEDANYSDDNDGTGKTAEDTNIYTTGQIGRHKVVLVYMPGMGKIPAAAVAANLKQSFKGLKLTVLVGICGGVPGEKKKEIALGDVIIGKQVAHYDFGSQDEKGFRKKDNPEDGLGRQGPEVRGFIRKLESGTESLERRTSEYLPPILKSCGVDTVDSLQDGVYPEDYWHIHQDPKNCSLGRRCQNGKEVCEGALNSSCEELDCDNNELKWTSDPKPKPSIYFGSVASGDKVMKSATMRDKIAKEERIIAFDMEAAGLWDYLPCIVIKGVADYADSHKNKKWQGYAAATAAACAKAALEEWNQADRPSGLNRVRTQFNNYNSKIANQVEQLNIYGTQTITF